MEIRLKYLGNTVIANQIMNLIKKKLTIYTRINKNKIKLKIKNIMTFIKNKIRIRIYIKLRIFKSQLNQSKKITTNYIRIKNKTR
jgi:hypothetical protein